MRHLSSILFWGAALLLPLVLPVSCTEKPDGGEEQENELILADTALTLPAEGGKFSMGFTLAFPVEGGAANAECGADWIDGLSVSDTAVSFVVSAYGERDPRSSEVLVRYMYGGTMLTAEFVVEQSGLGYDVRMDAVDYQGLYTISSSEDTLYAELYFSDAVLSSPGSTTLWIKVPLENSEASSRGLAEGEYSLGADGSFGTLTDALYFTTNETSDDFASLTVLTEGSIKVTAAEDGGYRYEAYFTGEDSLVYYVGCNAYGGLEDLEAVSTLERDIAADLSDHEICQATFYGKMSRAWGWSIYVAPPVGFGDIFDITLYSEETTVDKGIPDGEYVCSTSREAGTFYTGTRTSTFVTGSWFTHYVRYGYCDTPILGGTITVTNNSDGTLTLKFDFVDDSRYPHRITGEWTGRPEYWEDVITG